MARQYILAGLPVPIFVNETGTADYALPGVFLNETQVSTALTPGAGAALVTGFAPTVAVGMSLTPGAGNIALAGFAPAVTVGTSLAPGAGGVALTGSAPTVAAGISLTPGAGALVVTGFAPDVAEGDLVAADVGLLAIAGYAPEIVVGTATHVVVGGGGGGGRYIRPQALLLVGVGESEQPAQTAGGLGTVGGGIWSAQSAQTGHGAGGLSVDGPIRSATSSYGHLTGWLDLKRGSVRSVQSRATARGTGDLAMTVVIRSGIARSRAPDYDADGMAFEDDDFMSDLCELEDA